MALPETPELAGIVISDSIAWGGTIGNPNYQTLGRERPSLYLFEDVYGNERWRLDDAKTGGTGTSRMAELAKGDVSQVPVAAQWVNNDAQITPTKALVDTLQYGGSNAGPKMIATVLSADGAGSATITVPFLCDHDYLENPASIDQDVSQAFGMIYLGVQNNAAAPNFQVDLVDSEATVISGLTIAGPSGGFLGNGVLQPQKLLFQDFFGPNHAPSTAVLLARAPANIVITITWTSGEIENALVGTVLIGTNQRALVP